MEDDWWEGEGEYYVTDVRDDTDPTDREPDPRVVAEFTEFVTGGAPPPTELVVTPNPAIERKRETLGRIESLTNEVLSEAMSSIQAAQRWHEVDPADTEPPADWVEKLGEKEALRQWRIAREAQQPAKHVAYGLKMSVDVASGIMKSRGKEEPAKQLNVQFIQIQQPVFNYPSKRVER
jgi:hypothetical protein